MHRSFILLFDVSQCNAVHLSHYDYTVWFLLLLFSHRNPWHLNYLVADHRAWSSSQCAILRIRSLMGNPDIVVTYGTWIELSSSSSQCFSCGKPRHHSLYMYMYYHWLIMCIFYASKLDSLNCFEFWFFYIANAFMIANVFLLRTVLFFISVKMQLFSCDLKWTFTYWQNLFVIWTCTCSSIVCVCVFFFWFFFLQW